MRTHLDVHVDVAATTEVIRSASPPSWPAPEMVIVVPTFAAAVSSAMILAPHACCGWASDSYGPGSARPLSAMRPPMARRSPTRRPGGGRSGRARRGGWAPGACSACSDRGRSAASATVTRMNRVLMSRPPSSAADRLHARAVAVPQGRTRAYNTEPQPAVKGLPQVPTNTVRMASTPTPDRRRDREKAAARPAGRHSTERGSRADRRPWLRRTRRWAGTGRTPRCPVRRPHR